MPFAPLLSRLMTSLLPSLSQVVIFHDDSLLRLTGDPRRISDVDYADLPAIKGFEVRSPIVEFCHGQELGVSVASLCCRAGAESGQLGRGGIGGCEHECSRVVISLNQDGPL
jgi:hypothetical protein